MNAAHFGLIAIGLLVAVPATSPVVDALGPTILEQAAQLKNGEFVWEPDRSPSGSALLVVNLQTQKAVLFRNGIPIAATTISSGKPGNSTPTGVFTILQKRKEHYSSTYNNAPMPNMQRLTWQGIALHAGNLPGYPASHGCIRLPHKFSSLLFGATQVGMTVVITKLGAVPAPSDTPAVVAAAVRGPALPLTNAAFEWHPERAPANEDSMVSVVISAADHKAVVIRDGVEIGSAPVRVRGPLMPMAYVLRAWDSTGQHWLKLQFAGPGEGMEVSAEEGKRFEAPMMFRHSIATVLRPGSVVIVTPESLGKASTGRGQTVIEEEEPGQAQ